MRRSPRARLVAEAVAARIADDHSSFAGCSDLESVVVAARQAAMRLDEKRYGPLRRQLDYIKQHLPSAMKVAAERLFVHVATFDRYQLHNDVTVWILQTAHYDNLVLDVASAPIRTTAVTADGVIHPEHCRGFWPHTDICPPYWLLAYIVEESSQRHFQMLDQQNRQLEMVAVRDVITDEGLKQRSAPG